MIEKKAIVDAVLAMAGLQENFRKIIESTLLAYVDFVLTDQKWKFMLGSDTDSTTAGTTTYTLTGASNDLDTIHSIRYGTFKIPLKQLSVEKFDQMLAGASANIGEPCAYAITSISVVGGKVYPVIEFLGSPTSVQTIYIRYWKQPMSDPLGHLPDAFGLLFLLQMQYLYDTNAVRKETWRKEAEKAFFDLYSRYGHMSSEQPETVDETLEDLVKIWHGNSSYSQ